MAKELPPGTTRFGCRVVAITLDPSGSYPMLKLHDGSVIKSKIVIGCDGANSAISRYLGLKPTKVYEICATRGFTNYPTGHGLNNELTRIRKGKIIVGRAPVDDNLVYWFVGENRAARDSDLSQDVELFGQSTVKTIKSMDPEIVEMIKNNDTSLTSILRYRHPWDILFCNFSKGNVVLAGDAMHVMGPFVEQGGSTAIEDAVVLARCISRTMCGVDPTSGEQFMMWEQAAVAFEQYVRNRRRRLFWLALRIHLIGLLGEPSTSTLACFIYSSLLVLLFHNFYGHAQYDCGNL
ncbi:hypothetical protein Nepgr_026732 [Nepenthes gracilis]|uniref:FAD-binding domain-containing protein n=1 Tax=Nepenthes gracilis TaxID=150966 RepID=A0AAD3T9K2_NEPGR|nr:hypothetical protein Nepgr_026732 [Nepenthes gracilis]